MTQTHKSDEKRRLVTITVNNRPVEVDGPRITGLGIKEAAIAQGVNIGVDFQLARIRPNGNRDIVGDADVVMSQTTIPYPPKPSMHRLFAAGSPGEVEAGTNSP